MRFCCERLNWLDWSSSSSCDHFSRICRRGTMYLMGCVDTVGSAFALSVLLLFDVGDAVKSSENVDATVGAGEANFVWQLESLQLQSLNVDDALS